MSRMRVNVTGDGVTLSGYVESPEVLAEVEVGTCPAALNLAGEHFACDWPLGENGRHDGWAHTNKAAQAVWKGIE